MSIRNKAVVRMLSRTVNMTYIHSPSDMSGIEPDKSELYARTLLKKLQVLSESDPNNKFGTYLTRLVTLLTKQVQNGRH
jgi:hypothetical protein